MMLLLYIIAGVLAVIRISGHTSETYQAAAHLFVGGLIAAAYINWNLPNVDIASISNLRSIAKHYAWMATGLSIVEVACFLWFRFGAI